MIINVKQYEVCTIGSLVVGDMYVHKNELYTVLRKSFDSITVFNNHRHNTDMIYLPASLDVTRVIRGDLMA